jgi:two-component system, NarL family, invasion response regulator UvrY
MSSAKILIADDHEVVRQGLERILQNEFSDAHIETVKDGMSLLEKVETSKWDLVITDLTMPTRTGLEALEEIKSRFPELPVLILTMHPEEQYAIRALRSGASGYLSKSMDAAELITAARQVMSGRKYITPSLAEKLSDFVNSPSNGLPHQTLSDREFEVLKMLASGQSLIRIGNLLAITPTSVSTYRARILKKLHLTSNAELTRYALQHQLID